MLITLATAIYAYALTSMDRTPNGRLTLAASDCAEVAKSSNAFVEWKTLLGEKPGATPQPIQANGQCQADVTDLLPTLVQKLHRQETGSGPNCWDTTLYTRGILDAPRFASASEFSFWLASPFCRELKAKEAALPGDLIAMRDLDGKNPEELHGMTYLTPELAWSKNSPASESPYAVQRSELVFQTFHIYGCEKEEGINPKCASWANYYRCENPSAAREGAFAADAELADVNQRLQTLEKVVGATLNGQVVFNEAAFLASLEGLNATIAANQAKGFFWRAAWQEGQSLLAQARIFTRKHPTSF